MCILCSVTCVSDAKHEVCSPKDIVRVEHALLSSTSDYGQDEFAIELGTLSSSKTRLYSVELICRLKDIVFFNFNAFALNGPR
jgi:hypothetical protein